jgi:hypothetical protein
LSRGKPLISFDEILSVYAPDRYEMNLPIDYWRINLIRGQCMNQAGKMDYKISNFISPHAVIAKDI